MDLTWGEAKAPLARGEAPAELQRGHLFPNPLQEWPGFQMLQPFLSPSYAAKPS